jgi:hypothetical protein
MLNKFYTILSQKLEDEILYIQETFLESAENGETLSRGEAIRRIAEDSDEPNHYASNFRTELNKLLISLGCYKLMSQKDLDNTYVSRGYKYDLKYKGNKYKFESWEPLMKL